MKRLAFFSTLFLVGCAGNAPEIKRLSPILEASKTPSQCQAVSVVKDSPAEKAGIAIGDIVAQVNGQTPQDASALSDLVSAAPADSDFVITKKDGTSEHLRIHLNSSHPRLGTVCDLTGMTKPGVTAAGNESVTVFDGPYSLTASGIVDKQIVFLRVRLTNNSDQALAISPALFTASDGSGAAMPVLSPQDVMCLLYGEKGAHLLSLKRKHNETLDAQESIPGAQDTAEDHCPFGATGRLSSSDPQFVEANAQYLASESLWPGTYAAGSAADGLIYLKETSSLPITLKGVVDGKTMVAQLGSPIASQKQMRESELADFFQAQKKGTSLRLTLKKGKVFVGKFASYDVDEERVWFNTPSGGMLNTTSYSLGSIQYAEPLDEVPAKADTGGEHLN